jgi:hypothetical protein
MPLVEPVTSETLPSRLRGIADDGAVTCTFMIAILLLGLAARVDFCGKSAGPRKQTEIPDGWDCDSGTLTPFTCPAWIDRRYESYRHSIFFVPGLSMFDAEPQRIEGRQ